MTNIVTEAVQTSQLGNAFAFLTPHMIYSVRDRALTRLEWPVEDQVNWNIRWFMYLNRAQVLR